MTTFERAERGVERAAAVVAITGGLGLIFATLVTCVSIILKLLRRALDGLFGSYFETVPWSFVRPILGEEELVAYAVGFALFAALPWVMIKKGHIKVDLFEQAFSRRFNRVLNLIGDIALAAIAYLILTRQWFLIFKKARKSEEPMLTELLGGNFAVIADRLRDSQVSQVLGLKVWPMYVIAEICVVLFFLAAMFCVIRSARALVTGRRS